MRHHNSTNLQFASPPENLAEEVTARGEAIDTEKRERKEQVGRNPLAAARPSPLCLPRTRSPGMGEGGDWWS